MKVRFGPETPENIAFTANLSEHGILLQTNHVHPPGTALQVEVDAADYPTFTLLGRVVWVKKVPSRLRQVRPSTMGISFREPTKDWVDFYVDNGIRMLPMTEIVERGIDPCTREIFDIAWNGTDAIYCSWDTDSLDASCMPGTTAPECFGIKAREAIQLARIAGTYGADILEISELSPIFDVSQMSTKLACCLIYHYLGSRAQTLRDRGDA